MYRGQVAQRYAKALFAECGEQERQSTREVIEWLIVILQNKNIGRFFANLAIDNKIKSEVLDQILTRVAAPSLLKKTGQLLIISRRAHLLGPVGEAFVDILDAERGIVNAQVVSAVPLTSDEATSILASLRKIMGQDITLHQEVDPRILGGLTIEMGNCLIDLSLRASLTKLVRPSDG